MSAKLYRRCACRTPEGKGYTPLADRPTAEQLARACPDMADSSHGRWTFRLGVGGKQVSGGTYATRREAAQARNRLAVQIDAGKVPSMSRETLAEYLPRWLGRAGSLGTARSRRPLAPSTLDAYRRYAEVDIAPSALGRMQLRDIRRRHVQAFIDQVASERGAATVRLIVAVLQGCLSSAVRDQLLDESPAHDFDLPSSAAEPFEPWTPAQVGHFLDVAGQHRLGALFELAVWTGLRRGELLALTWADVDLAERELRVRRSKSATGLRRVPLADAAVGALVAWQLAQGASAGLVFSMPDGRPIRPQYATRLFDTLRRRAGLPDLTLHGLRHMAASLLLASGAELEFVSKVLGHADVRVTSSTYSHLISGAGQGHVDRAAALVPRVGLELVPDRSAVSVDRGNVALEVGA